MLRLAWIRNSSCRILVPRLVMTSPSPFRACQQKRYVACAHVSPLTHPQLYLHVQTAHAAGDSSDEELSPELRELRGAHFVTKQQLRVQAADGGEGSVPIAKVDGELLAINIVVAYAFRHRLLKDYSLYEFFCLLFVIKLSEREDKAKRRGFNGVFELNEECLLAASHATRLLSKHLVPKLYPVPPSLPLPSSRNDKPAAWAAAAHSFARYALVTWKPWNIDTHLPDTPLNWQSFCTFAAECRDGTAAVGRFIGGVRLQWMSTSAQFLSTPGPIKAAIMGRRARAADQWASKDKAKDEAMINRGIRHPGAVAGDAGEEEDPEKLRRALASIAMLLRQQQGESQRHVADELERRANAAHISDALTDAYRTSDASGEPAEPRRVRPMSLVGSGCESANIHLAEESVDALYLSLQKGEATSEAEPDIRPALPRYGPDEPPRPPSATLATVIEKLNAEQRPIYDRCRDQAVLFARWVVRGCKGDPPKPLLLFLHGGPGVGKSYLICAIRLFTFELGLRDITAAPFAAAANVIKGLTYHYALSHNGRAKLNAVANPKAMKALAIRHGIDHCWVFMGDETSGLGPVMFNSGDIRLGVMTQRPHLRWGGLSVIMIGDFYQLPPVPPLSIFDVIIKHYVFKDANLPLEQRRAAEFFVTLEKIELVINMRARDDPTWAAVLRCLRDPTPGRRPLADSLLPLLEQMILTQADVLADPEFRNAVVLLCGNYERSHIIASRVQALARSLGVPVVRWRLALSGDVATMLTPEQTERIYEANPTLWAYFVKYAEVFLSKNVNARREVSRAAAPPAV